MGAACAGRSGKGREKVIDFHTPARKQAIRALAEAQDRRDHRPADFRVALLLVVILGLCAAFSYY